MVPGPPSERAWQGLAVGKGVKLSFPDRFTLNPSSLASVKVNYSNISVVHGMELPPPDRSRLGAHIFSCSSFWFAGPAAVSPTLYDRGDAPLHFAKADGNVVSRSAGRR